MIYEYIFSYPDGIVLLLKKVEILEYSLGYPPVRAYAPCYDSPTLKTVLPKPLPVRKNHNLHLALRLVNRQIKEEIQPFLSRLDFTSNDPRIHENFCRMFSDSKPPIVRKKHGLHFDRDFPSGYYAQMSNDDIIVQRIDIEPCNIFKVPKRRITNEVSEDNITKWDKSSIPITFSPI